MIKISLKRFISDAKIVIVVIMIAFISLAETAHADNINLDMQGGTATIPKGNTVNRNLYGIPAGIPGRLRLRLKWHAVNILPTFNRLKVQVRHGNTILKTTNCYSMHSNKSPKCNFTVSVSQGEANKSGFWKLRITNNSNYEVLGFDIEKGSDLNPFVPSFKSFYTPNCPSTVNLDMEGTTLTLTKGATQFRKIYGIRKSAGTLRLKAKWHAVNILPTYNRLTIQLLKPNGQIVKTGSYYSIHAPRRNNPKFDIGYNISAADAALPGIWKLKITNDSKYEVLGFNIEKESGEINPLVPNFFSSYKTTCSF